MSEDPNYSVFKIKILKEFLSVIVNPRITRGRLWQVWPRLWHAGQSSSEEKPLLFEWRVGGKSWRRQGSLACRSIWGHKESEDLADLTMIYYILYYSLTFFLLLLSCGSTLSFEPQSCWKLRNNICHYPGQGYKWKQKEFFSSQTAQLTFVQIPIAVMALGRFTCGLSRWSIWPTWESIDLEIGKWLMGSGWLRTKRKTLLAFFT